MQPTRRQFVAAGGLAAVLGTTGLAGCSGLLGGGGTSAESLQYDPAEVADTGNVLFGSMNYGDLYEMRDELPPSAQDSFEVDDEDSPFQASDVDQMVGVGGGDVGQMMQSTSFFGSLGVTGSFDRQTMVDEIESEGEVTSAGEYGNFALYEVPELSQAPVGGVGQQTPQGSGTIGLSNGAMVMGVGVAQNSDLAVDGEEAAKAMIDASSGDVPRLSGSSGPAQDLQSRINDRLMAVGAEVDPDLVEMAQSLYGGGPGMGGGAMLNGIRAGGLGADIDPETTTYEFVLIYDSGSSAEESGIADLVDGMSSQMEQQPAIDSVSSSRDGAAVTVEMSGSTEQILDQGPGAGAAPLALGAPTR